MDKDLFIIIGVSLGVVMPIVIYIVNMIDKRDKAKVNAGASIFVKKKRYELWYRCYRVFLRIPFTKAYYNKIERRFELLCPSDPKSIAIKTMKVIMLTWFLCSLIITIVFILKPNFHNGILAIVLVYVIHREVINFIVGRVELKLLEHMVIFISNIRHNYYINRMVDEAILDSLDGLCQEMKVHGYKLYEIITSNDINKDLLQYNVATHNKYLKMLLSLCISVQEFTDKKVNGQYLFTSNLEYLNREINMEILKLKKLKFVFAGTVFVTISVCIPIDAIQRFGISIIPELESFYKGRNGLLFVVAIYLTAVFVYLLNDKLKELKEYVPNNNYFLMRLEKMTIIKKALDNYSEKNYGKMLKLKDTLKRIGEHKTPRQLLLQQMLVFLLTFTLSLSFVLFTHHSNRYQIIHHISNIEAIALQHHIKQTDLLEETIRTYVKQFKHEKVLEEEVLYKLSVEAVFYNTKIHQIIAQEVVTRINRYQEQYLRWYEVLVCLLISIIAYYIPYGMVLYRKKILQLSMEEEVNQFQSIIYMLMYIDHMTVKDILIQLELFSVVFKSSLQECINNYNSGDIEALLRLKEKERFGPFQRLVDNLIRCDLIAIDKAFDEIASDRQNYYERRKQENEISIHKRSDTARLLSWIPAVLVTLYLLLPIFVASLKELEAFRESLSLLGY